MLVFVSWLTLVNSFPGGANAQDALDLELGGTGSTAWHIGNIKPGDSGSETVTLHNVGSQEGSVTIWFSDMENHDSAGDGAVLGDYLLFNISCPQISTNIPLPASLNYLVNSISGGKSLRVTGLGPGETVNLSWIWEFHENGFSQNAAQGDSVSFTINYQLADSSSTETTAPGGAEWFPPSTPDTGSLPPPTVVTEPPASTVIEPSPTTPAEPDATQSTTPPAVQPEPTAVSPAMPDFKYSDLVISPYAVNPDQSVTVSFSVTNVADSERTCLLSLVVNGLAEQSNEFVLGSGEEKQVVFTVTKAVPGVYLVDINGVTGKFAVLAPVTTASRSYVSFGIMELAILIFGVVLYRLVKIRWFSKRWGGNKSE